MSSGTSNLDAPLEEDGDYLSPSKDYSGGFAALNPSARGRDAADRLQAILQRGSSWPIWSADRVGGVDTGTYAQVGMYGQTARDIALWVAMREHDRGQIINLTNWNKGRVLHLDPLPERVCSAFSDLLYGSEPDFLASSQDDQSNMDDMTEDQGLADQFRSWVDMSVSEGEVWWRMWTDADASEWPLVSGHSRLNVIPLFAGHKILAAAFVDPVYQQKVRVENDMVTMYWRHVEIQAVGHVRNLLYYGSIGTLGELRPLTSLVETQDLEEEWDHNLPFMLAGRIPNKLGRDFRLGISEFKGVRDMFMDLNEARTIMAENARLVLKARMVVPASAVDRDGNFDASEDIVVAETMQDELGSDKQGPYSVLEYNFQSKELIEHKTELTLDILDRCGLAEQFVQGSRGGGGQAFTGTALRTRLIPTTLAASGKARKFDREAPKILRAGAMLSALPIEKGGCGKSWADASGTPVQRRASILPEDLNEEVQRHVMAVQGEVESVQTAVTQLHAEDDWDDDQIELEVQRIHADRSGAAAFAPPGMTPEEFAAQQAREQAALDIPNVPPGGPGSKVPTPADVVGSQQPGAGRPVDGQSPGKQVPKNTAGGPK